MCDTHETIYLGQEFFRISHAGERAGLYRVEVLPTGEEAETRLGGPLRASVITGDGGGLLLEWLDPANHPHSHVIPAEKMRGRLVLPLRRMARGGCAIISTTKSGGGCSGASLWRCGTRYVGRAEHGQGPFRQRA